MTVSVAAWSGLVASLTIGLASCAATSSGEAQKAVVIAADTCGADWSPPQAGQVAITVRNETPQPSTISLLGSNQERTIIDPQPVDADSSRELRFGLNPGTYAWRCSSGDTAHRTSDLFTVPGSQLVSLDPIDPPSQGELVEAANAYKAEISPRLVQLSDDVDSMVADIDRADVAAAKRSWLVAHLDYVRLGAAYGAFGDADARINGMADGLADGVSDSSFTGFHRVEAVLWSASVSQSDASSVARQLQQDVKTLIAEFPDEQIPVLDVPLRAHEILENGLQRELTGADDFGSHSELSTVLAEIDATRLVLQVLDHTLQSHADPLRTQAGLGLDSLASLIDSLRLPDDSLPPLDELDPSQRRHLDGATTELLETLAHIPIALEPIGDGD